MKKVMFFIIMVSLLLVVNSKKVNACISLPIDIDEFIGKENQILVIGTVHKKLSNQRMILEVTENYSKTTVDQYITIFTSDQGMCTVEIERFKGQKVLISGRLDEDGTEVYNYKIRSVEDGTVNNIKLNDQVYETITITKLDEYLSDTLR